MTSHGGGGSSSNRKSINNNNNTIKSVTHELIDQDPLLKRIHDNKLPIIWIIGEPTTNTKQTVKTFCNQLALSLDFKYINLDDKIGEWFEREILKTPARYWQVIHNRSKNQQQSRQLSLIPPKNGAQIKVRARLTNSLFALANAHDRTNKNLLRSSINPSTSISTSSKKAVAQAQQHGLTEINVDTREPLSRDKVMEIIKYAMIENLHTKGWIIDGPFVDRMDFIKFKQIFYIPTVGLYFTESPVNTEMTRYNTFLRGLSDPKKVLRTSREETERIIHGKVSVVKPRNFRRVKPYSFIDADHLCDEFKDKIVRVVNAEHLNRSTGRFITSLIRAHLRLGENDQSFEQKERTKNEGGHDDKKSFISDVSLTDSRKRLLKLMKDHKDDGLFQDFPVPFLNKKKLPRHDGHKSHSFDKLKEDLSVVSSTTKKKTKMSLSLSEVRGPVEKSKSSSTERSSSNERINAEFEKIKSKNVPIIWIFGYKQSAIAQQRLNCCKFLAKYFDFTFVQMDDEIVKWYRYFLKDYWDPHQEQEEFPELLEEPEDLHDLIFYRAKKIIRKVIPMPQTPPPKTLTTFSFKDNNNNYLTVSESCQLIKFAMILAMPTNGFIIDNFPVSTMEATEFEKELYPCMVGMYFTSSAQRHPQNNHNKGGTMVSMDSPMRNDKPKYFIRQNYSENEVEGLCFDFRRKTIKIINVEDLRDEGMKDICEMVERHLRKASNRTLSPKHDHQHQEQQELNSSSQSRKSGRKMRKKPSSTSKQPEILIIKRTSSLHSVDKKRQRIPLMTITAPKKNAMSQTTNDLLVHLQKEKTVSKYSPTRLFRHMDKKRRPPPPPAPPPPKTNDVGVGVNLLIKRKKKVVKTRAVMTDTVHDHHQQKPQKSPQQEGGKNKKNHQPKDPNNGTNNAVVVKLWEGNFASVQSFPEMNSSTFPIDYNNAHDDEPMFLHDDESTDAENFRGRGQTAKVVTSVLKGGHTQPYQQQQQKQQQNQNRQPGQTTKSNSGWHFSNYFVLPNDDENPQNSQIPKVFSVIVAAGPGHHPAVDDVTLEFSPHAVGHDHDKISMPSTIYETANSSEDDFDEDEDDLQDDDDDDELSARKPSKASTIQGLIFGPGGRKSKGGLISPDSKTMAIQVSHKVSSLQAAINKLRKAEKTATHVHDEKRRVEHNKNQCEQNKESGNDKNRGWFWTGIFRAFRNNRRRSKSDIKNQ